MEQERRRRRRVGRREGAAREEALHQIARHGHQRRGGGQRERQAEHHRLVHGRIGVVVVLGLQRGRQARQQGHADGDAHQAERQLVEALGDVQPDPHPGHLAGQHGGNEEVDLGGARGDHPRHHAANEDAHVRRQLQMTRMDAGAGLVCAPPAERRLADAGDDHADGGRIGRPRGVLLRQDRKQHHDVQQGRIEAVDDEPAARLQHACEERGDHHAGQVGHGDLGEDHRQLEFGRIGQEAIAVDPHEPGHGELAGDGQGHHRRGHGRQGVRGEGVGRFLAVGGQAPRIVRHEGRGEGALGEHPAEQVREGQGRIVGVGRDVAGAAQLGRDHQVPRQAQEPADQGQRRIDRRGAEQAGSLLRRGGGSRDIGHGSGVSAMERLKSGKLARGAARRAVQIGAAGRRATAGRTLAAPLT